jgi:hypothetical protein
MVFTLPDIPGLPSRQALERLVYVVGPVRGGTTVLYHAVGLHPEVLTFPGMTHFVNHVWRYRNKVHERLLRILLKLPYFFREEKEILDGLAPEHRLAWTRLVNTGVRTKDMVDMWTLYPVLHALSPTCGKDAAGLRCWCEKSNDFGAMGDIARAFPQARFLFIVRDPLASVSSMAVRSAQKQGEAQPGVAYDDLLASCIHWSHMTLRMHRFASQRPGMCRMIRFEDLVGDTLSTLAGIHGFLGLSAMSAADMEEHVGKLSYRATNNPKESGSGMDTRPLERWREVLAPEEIEVIRTVTGRIARCVGYPGPGNLTPGAALSLALRVPGLKRRAVTLGKLLWITAFSALSARPAAGQDAEQPAGAAPRP